jgi:predicted transporter
VLKALGRVVVGVLLVMVGFHAIRGSIYFAGILFLIAAVLIATAFASFRAPVPPLTSSKK